MDSITVWPAQNIVNNNNCSGQLDYYLCNCVADNATIEIYLSSGYYHFQGQNSCILQGQSNISIIGSTNDSTVIQCSNFNMAFLEVQNVFISNIQMINCGSLFNDAVNETITNISSYTYFGKGSRFALMFLLSTNVTINNLTMRNTLGYGIISFNTFGTLVMSRSHIQDTTFENDEICMGYNYEREETDFYCSGSGIAIIFAGSGSNSASVSIKDCLFTNNTNNIPYLQYKKSFANMDTVYTGSEVPFVGAGCVTIYSTQFSYKVKTLIANSIFYNNNGTFTASVAILTAPTTNSTTTISNCNFNDNNRMKNDPSESDINVSGGIFYIQLALGYTLMQFHTLPGIKFEGLTIVHSNFTLQGGKSGAAIHIEKQSPITMVLSVRIKWCTFVDNEANSGSAIFAKDDATKIPFNSTPVGNLIIYLININAYSNKLFHGSTLEYISGDFITGVYYFLNCLVVLECEEECNFKHNQPSVFYGQVSAMRISGSVVFQNNKARNGAALRLVDTVLYITINTSVIFDNNTAVLNGGAIMVEFPNFSIHDQDICPFQFVGLAREETITDIEVNNIQEILNINIIFQNNYAKNGTNLESIYASVFYICHWYADTSVQTQPSSESKIMNDTRPSVYHKAFNYYPKPISDHLNVIAIYPCVCMDSNSYANNVGDCLTGKSIVLPHPVIPGKRYSVYIVPIDTVGSVGYSNELITSAYTSNEELQLAEGQRERKFSATNNSCTSVDFTIYLNRSPIPDDGKLEMSLTVSRYLTIEFDFSTCPFGFVLRETIGKYGCVCDEFLTERCSDGFYCDPSTGLITRLNVQSWLSVIDGDIQYLKFCFPTFCNDIADVKFVLQNDSNILCTNYHAGRGCGGCLNNYSRVFGSDNCKQCSSMWLLTILLYAALGVMLVIFLFMLKFTVTFGAINGLIFFCNVMSINEELFFNVNISRFTFLRVFISTVNLDLGFEICFYDGMSQIVKTGLQFVFPVYLWLLILVIVYLSRYSYRFHAKISNEALPVLATLMFLSYSKVLQTSITVFSYVFVKSSNHGSITAWEPDPTIDYLVRYHIVLFCIASLFSLAVILATIGFTVPIILLRGLNHFFPLFDCFFAPYKTNCRYWFGLRLCVLVYLSIMEAVISDDKETVLLSSIVVVGTFAFIQASVFPFRNKLINIMDLIFTGIFLLLSSIVLYFHPNVNGYRKVNIAVNVLGYTSFVVFCVIIVYHIYHATKGFSCCFKFFSTVNRLRLKFEMNKDDDLQWPFAVFAEEPDQRYGTIRTQDETEA